MDNFSLQAPVMITRIVLAVVGVLYLYLGVWCTVSPAHTSKAVGFELVGGSGRSEFMTVYGGLEFGMGLLFLLPLLRPDLTAGSLWGCVLIHACLVAFRGYSLFAFDGISSMTWSLAKGEWVIFLVTLGLLVAGRFYPALR